MKKIEVSITPHPFYSDTHVLVKVYVRGRVYAASYAEDENGFPTEEKVLEDLGRYGYGAKSYKLFQPFDESICKYV